MKKLLTLLICITVSLNLVLVGCNNNVKTNKEDTKTTQETKTGDEKNAIPGVEQLTLPIVDPGSVTLTWGTYDNWYTPASYSQNLEIFKAIEKDTGVKIVWDIVPPSQYSTTMQTRLAAASNLPDFVNVPGDVVKYAADGLLIPIDDLINKYAPNTLKYFEADPVTKQVLTAPDGHIYIV